MLDKFWNFLSFIRTSKVTMATTCLPTLLNGVSCYPAGQRLASTRQGVDFFTELSRPFWFISNHNTDPERGIVHEETVRKVLQDICGCQIWNQPPLLGRKLQIWGIHHLLPPCKHQISCLRKSILQIKLEKNNAWHKIDINIVYFKSNKMNNWPGVDIQSLEFPLCLWDRTVAWLRSTWWL